MNSDGRSSTHLSTDILLDVSPNQDVKHFLQEGGIPTKEGIRPLTQCFIQGLVGNIHSAHQAGYWDSAEHLRYIIAELERGFIAPATVRKSNMT